MKPFFEHNNKAQYTSFSAAGPLHLRALHWHGTFRLPRVRSYTTELCRQEVEVIQNRENARFAT